VGDFRRQVPWKRLIKNSWDGGGILAIHVRWVTKCFVGVILHQGATMANPEHVEIVKRGKDAIAEWRGLNLERLDLGTADLSDANLSEANFTGANLTRADLSGADLSGANLYRSDLREADLSGAILRMADLGRADLGRANLSAADASEAKLISADLSEANLRDTNFGRAALWGAEAGGANLTGVDFSEASFWKTKFIDVDLSTVKNLEQARHFGPSYIGIDTLIRSQGKIPETFLRGCGVPDEVITYIRELVRSVSPIEFYSSFISYSHKDEEFAKRLHSRMQQEHLRVWYAPDDLKLGRKMHEEIDRAIRVHDKLLLVLSEESMESKCVGTEIKRAREHEGRDDEPKLFPIRLVEMDAIRKWKAFDAGSGEYLRDVICEYNIADFTKWKDHDEFERVFKKLLDSMKHPQSIEKVPDDQQ
jgi:uncharacterized protein YjbI with pentapeptide repeats